MDTLLEAYVKRESKKRQLGIAAAANEVAVADKEQSRE